MDSLSGGAGNTPCCSFEKPGRNRPVRYACEGAFGHANNATHTHRDERAYTVLAGEWKLGFGKKFDVGKLMTFPAGSVYRLPANVPHFQATGQSETIVQINSVGPSTTEFLNPSDGVHKK